MHPIGIPRIPFFSSDHLSTLWQNISALLYLAMPLLVIFVATEYGGYLIAVIRDSFSRRRQDDPGDYEDDRD